MHLWEFLRYHRKVLGQTMLVAAAGMCLSVAMVAAATHVVLLGGLFLAAALGLVGAVVVYRERKV